MSRLKQRVWVCPPWMGRGQGEGTCLWRGDADTGEGGLLHSAYQFSCSSHPEPPPRHTRTDAFPAPWVPSAQSSGHVKEPPRRENGTAPCPVALPAHPLPGLARPLGCRVLCHLPTRLLSP